jgi:hypothetical protein
VPETRLGLSVVVIIVPTEIQGMVGRGDEFVFMLSLRLEVELLDEALQHHHLVLQAAHSFERVRLVPVPVSKTTPDDTLATNTKTESVGGSACGRADRIQTETEWREREDTDKRETRAERHMRETRDKYITIET